MKDLWTPSHKFKSPYQKCANKLAMPTMWHTELDLAKGPLELPTC